MGVRLAAVLTVCLGSGFAAASASAAVGDLTQKPGTAGCISETGSGGICADGRGLDGADSVAVSPDGRNVYVAAGFGAAVAVFDRAADGTLTQKPGSAGCISETGSGGLCVDGRGLDAAISVAVSPDGNSVYVASSLSDAVAVFDRAADGTLTQKPGTAGCISETGSGGLCVDGRALDGARDVTVAPGGLSVYVTSPNSGAVAVFDRVADGTLTQKAGTAGCISDDGSGGQCFDGRALADSFTVEVSPAGTSAYVSSQADGAVAVFDRAADGTLTQKAGTAGCISDTGAPGCVDGIALEDASFVAVSPDGRTAYVVAEGSSSVALFDRAADGTLTQKPGSAACISDTGAPACVDVVALAGALSIEISPDGRSAYVVSGGSDDAVAVFDREPIPPFVPTPTPTPTPSDTTNPLLSALSLSPARFRAAPRGPSIAARVGSRVSYRLSESARVRFRIQGALPGQRVRVRGRPRCVRPRRSRLRARACTRWRTLRGSFTHQGQTGRNTLRFRGRVGGRKLRPGRYRLVATATDASGNRSQPVRRSFRIVRR